jgi:class 3 adenylate cyclase
MPGVPEGTVTFLLTDVEGSTDLWTSRPDEMPAAIAHHYELLDESISSQPRGETSGAR